MIERSLVARGGEGGKGLNVNLPSIKFNYTNCNSKKDFFPITSIQTMSRLLLELFVKKVFFITSDNIIEPCDTLANL